MCIDISLLDLDLAAASTEDRRALIPLQPKWALKLLVPVTVHVFSSAGVHWASFHSVSDAWEFARTRVAQPGYVGVKGDVAPVARFPSSTELLEWVYERDGDGNYLRGQ